MRIGRWQRLAVFFGIAFVGSGSLVLTFWALGGEWGSPASRAVGVLHLLPPAVGALVAQGAFGKLPILEPFGLRFPRSIWFVIAWLLPVALVLLGMGLAAAFGLELVTSTEELIDVYRSRMPADQLDAFEAQVAERTPPHPAVLFGYALLAGLTIDLVLSLGEELGFRGYLLAEIGGGFWRRSLLIGVVWAAWQAPSILAGHLYPDHQIAGVLLFAAWALVTSPIVTYVRLKCRSLFAAAAFRGSLMALWPVSKDLVRGGADWLVPPYGLLGIGAAAVVLGALWAFDRFVAEQSVIAMEPSRPSA